MARPPRDEFDLQAWGHEFPDGNPNDFGGVVIPPEVKEVDREHDAVLILSAAGISLAVLAGYGVKRVLKKRKS